MSRNEQRSYDNIYRKSQRCYDIVYRESLKRGDRPDWIYQRSRIRSAMLGYLKKLTPKCIVEVGVGKGEFALQLSRQEINYYYVGIDISREGVKIAHQRARNHRFHFLMADARYLPFRQKRFHSAICSEVIEHIREKGRLLHEINRVLKTDGSLILTTPNPRSLIYTIPRLMDKVLKSFGSEFRYVSEQPFEEQLEPRELMRLLENTFFSILDYKGLYFRFHILYILEQVVKKSFMTRVSEYLEEKGIFRFFGLYQVILAKKAHERVRVCVTVGKLGFAVYALKVGKGETRIDIGTAKSYWKVLRTTRKQTIS